MGNQRLATYLARLFGYALSLANDREEARDLVQECALRALGAANVPRDEAAYRAWLFTILRNTFIDQRRRVGRAQPWEDVAPEGDAPQAWTRDEAMVNSLTVKIGLAKLSIEHREIISLIDVVGLSYAEASQFLGVPAGTIMSRLSRARQALLAVIAASNVRALPVGSKRHLK